MTTHTPGTWTVDDTPDCNGNWWITAHWTEQDGDITIDSSKTIAVVEGWKNGPANARLIAAAPDLLAALERIANIIEEYGTPIDAANEAMHIARAAIAKAKGE
jgi:hypothetical protein